MTVLNRKPLYAKISIAKKQLGMDEETYRDMLFDLYTCRSAKALTDNQLKMLVHRLEELGATFTSKTPPKKTSQGGASAAATRPYLVKPHSSTAWLDITDSMEHAPMKRQICAIWKKLGYSMNSLDTRVKRSFNVDCFVWMQSFDNLSTLLSDLQRREKAFDRKKATQEGQSA